MVGNIFYVVSGDEFFRHAGGRLVQSCSGGPGQLSVQVKLAKLPDPRIVATWAWKGIETKWSS